MKKTDSKANREAYAKLSSLYKEWIQQCRSIVVANTIASYKASLKLFFLEYLAKVKHIISETFTLEDALSRDQITGWEKWFANERGNKPQSINIRRSNLIAFLEYISTKDLMYVQYYTAAKNIHCLKAIPVKTHSLNDKALELIINMPDVHTKTGLLDILFPESSRTPGMDGCQLIAVTYLIKATILDVELAHHLCHRIMGFVSNTFRGFLTGWCHAALSSLIYAARLRFGIGILLIPFPFVIIKRKGRRR